MSLIGIIASSKLGAPSAPVAGYSVWLDAADATTFTFSSGNVVSQWSDKSANAYAFTQGTVANQPTRSTTLNSKSTLLYDGSNDSLVSTAAASTWTFLSNGDGASVFAVLKSTQSSAGLSSWLDTNGGSTNDIGIFEFFNSNLFISDTLKGVSGVEITANVAHTISAWNVWSYYLDQDNATTADKIRIYKDDGGVNANNTTATTASNSNPSKTLNIGSTAYRFGGEMAEIIIYPSILTNTDRQANVDYLQAKWGL
jgi:hypothetical protein